MENSTNQNTEESVPCNPDDKKIRRLPYTGIYLKGKGGNQPVLCVHPDFLEEIEPTLALLEGQIIRASILIEEKPLITRLNLRGLKETVMTLLQKAVQQD